MTGIIKALFILIPKPTNTRVFEALDFLASAGSFYVRHILIAAGGGRRRNRI